MINECISCKAGTRFKTLFALHETRMTQYSYSFISLNRKLTMAVIPVLDICSMFVALLSAKALRSVRAITTIGYEHSISKRFSACTI